MGGKSGAGAFLLMNGEHFCSLRDITKQATVIHSEVIAVKVAAEALLSNDLSNQRIVFHADNQAILKTLVRIYFRCVKLSCKLLFLLCTTT
jgi:hypothetical protein